MSQWSLRERLQPSLLDRLIDEHPDRESEVASDQFLDQAALKRAVIRDLSALLNCVAFDVVHNLDRYPHVKNSVINYGVPDLSGQTAEDLVPRDIERGIMRAIQRFEPRILRSGLRVRVNHDAQLMSSNTLVFEIEGVFFGQPAPFQVSLKSELDVQNGNIHVVER